MAAGAGRDVVIEKNGTAIAGARTTALTWNGEPIDITDQASGSPRVFLADVLATDTLEISVSGVEKGTVLRAAALSGTDGDKHMADIEFNFADGATLTGTFILTSWTYTGEYEGAATFDATFRRSGAGTYTPAV